MRAVLQRSIEMLSFVHCRSFILITVEMPMLLLFMVSFFRVDQMFSNRMMVDSR